jgi:hypothetical protein
MIAEAAGARGGGSCSTGSARSGVTAAPRGYLHGMTTQEWGLERTAAVRGETREQVLDRNVAELLQELRVVLTGVQILFAFLLTLPFTARFGHLDARSQLLYAVTLLSTALATVVLIAPVSFHRLLFRRGAKEQLVAFGARAMAGALLLLLVSIGSGLLLVLDVTLPRSTAAACTGVVVLSAIVAWYCLPLRHRWRPRA